MTLARAWSQRILGASLVAVLVPGAVLGAVAVAALTGGLGRIGDLAQALSGPGVPPPPAAVRAPRRTHHWAGRRPPVVKPPPAVRAGAVARYSGPPTLTDRVIGVASGVTSRLPGPAGPAATTAVNQAGAALDKLLPAAPAAGSGPGVRLP